MAAEQSVELRGRVSDASNRPLVGAAVNVQPGDIRLVTDAEGFFATHQLAPGTYTVTVLYLGSETHTQEVKIEGGKPASLLVKLVPAANGPQVVTVTATRIRGEVEALNQEKNAMDIVNVLPADVITSLPNANIADAIGRLPSVSLERDEGEGKYVQVRGLESRYTSVSINGVRIPSAEAGVRQIKLDAFPSDIVGTIELHKTVSADQEGDSIGGSINMVTRIAPEVPFYSIGAEGGYNAQGGGRENGTLHGIFARRFGADNELGVVLSASYDYNGRTINDIEPSVGYAPLPSGVQIPTFTGMDIRDYTYNRHRWGMAGSLDYRLSDTSMIYLKGFFSEFEDFGQKWVTNVSIGNLVTPTTDDGSGGYSASVNNRRPVQETYSFVLGGKHDMKSYVWDWNLAYSHAQSREDNEFKAKFDGPSAALVIDPGNGHYPHFYPQGGVNPLDPNQYTLSKVSITNEDSYTRASALETNFLIPCWDGELKVGVKYRDEDKDSLVNDPTYKYKGAPVSMAASSFTDPGYYKGMYSAGPFASLAAVNALFQSDPTDFKDNASDDHIGNDPNIWSAQEKVAAIYVKRTDNFKNSKLEYGVRVEHTNTSFQANQVNFDTSGAWTNTQPVTQSSNYTNVLPSVSWRYELDKDTILRLVFGMALARPDYSELVPSLQPDPNLNNTVDAGNPNLKPTTAANYDVLFEKYLQPVGLLSAGVFYKDLNSPIYPGASSVVVGGPYAGYTKIQAINGPHAYVEGFEFAWKQHLTYLPGIWSGLGTDINLTLTKSEATFDASTGRSGTAPLQRTAPVEWNLGLTYDWKAFSMRVAATYNSAMIFTYNYVDGALGGTGGPNGDIYLLPHIQLDAQASYAISHHLKLTASILNINNEVFGFYQGSPQWTIQREFYGPTYNIGFKYEF